MPAAAAQEVATFERSLHEGSVDGVGTLAGMNYYGLRSGSAVLSFERADFEQAWQNGSVQTSLVGGTIGVPKPDRAVDVLGSTVLRLLTNQEDATMTVLVPGGDASWNVHADHGELSVPEHGTKSLEDQVPFQHSGGELQVPVVGTSLWRSTPTAANTVTGDFWVSLFGWTAADEDGVSFQTGRSNPQGTRDVRVEDVSAAWLFVQNGTLTVDFADGAVADAFVHGPTITTDGTTTLIGLPTQPRQVFHGTTTLRVTASGDDLHGFMTEGGTAPGTSPSTSALSVPAGSPWLWGGVAASAFVAAFVFVALAARSVPMLEWRSYHSLDRHRPRLAAFWANLWTRRDPWDGHAWSARGEARLLIRHDRGAARDFTKAHTLLPPEERAVNALHAARAHARMGHATQTAHWIGIVASLDINVLLTAREEPDFARVWDHASVQRAVRQVLGIGV